MTRRHILAACLLCAAALSLPKPAAAWGGDEHSWITKAAVEALPPQQRNLLGGEAEALWRIYCHFPDVNWPCYGNWGGGDGDPTAPRFPNLVRLWELWRYTRYNPLARQGKFVPHRAPESFDHCPLLLGDAAFHMRNTSLPDGARVLGVLLHYVEDTAAFGHLQPIHRRCHMPTGWKAKVTIAGYKPRKLGPVLDAAEMALRRRLQALVDFCERQAAPLIEAQGLSMDKAKQLCAQRTMPGEPVRAVDAAIRADQAAWQNMALSCALESAKLCADVLYTTLTVARGHIKVPEPPKPGPQVAFNPSFEVTAPGIGAEGWCVRWLNPTYRAGRAYCYTRGEHWTAHVRTGAHSLLVLWPPKEGIEWEQTWPRATACKPGQIFRLRVYAQTAGDGAASAALEFYSADYRLLVRVPSKPVRSKEWALVEVSAEAPEDAAWVKAVLRGTGSDGACWFDDVQLVRER